MGNQKIAAIILEAGRKIRDEATSIEHEQRIAMCATEKILKIKEVLSLVIGGFEPTEEQIKQAAERYATGYSEISLPFALLSYSAGARWALQIIKRFLKDKEAQK